MFMKIGLKKALLKNPGLKVLSVVLALSLWLYVTYQGQSEMVIEAPLEFKNVPKGMELVKQTVKKANLSIRGHERILRNLRPTDSRVVIDLANGKEGETTYYFDKEDIVIPRTVKVLRMDPTSVKVTLDESISRVVSIKAYVVGAPEEGYRVQSFTVDPPSVTAEGAKGEVSRLAILRTEPVDITGIDRDLVQSAKINTTGKNIRLSVSEATVSVTVRRVQR